MVGHMLALTGPYVLLEMCLRGSYNSEWGGHNSWCKARQGIQPTWYQKRRTSFSWYSDKKEVRSFHVNSRTAVSTGISIYDIHAKLKKFCIQHSLPSCDFTFMLVGWQLSYRSLTATLCRLFPKCFNVPDSAKGCFMRHRQLSWIGITATASNCHSCTVPPNSKIIWRYRTTSGINMPNTMTIIVKLTCDFQRTCTIHVWHDIYRYQRLFRWLS